MHEPRAVSAKYVCIDIVGYTRDRSVDAQLYVRGALDEIVRLSITENSIPESNLMYFTTGDGMCVALLNIPDPKDIHLKLALSMLKGTSEHNSRMEAKECQIKLRIGIHDYTDHIITAIHGKDDIVGAGINTAFRIMDLADGDQILVSQRVYSELQYISEYMEYDEKKPFARHDTRTKHGYPITVYQFLDEDNKYLNRDKPRHMEEQSNFIEPGLALGLSKVHISRGKEVAEDLTVDLSNAEKRIWLLGVGLSNNFAITNSETLRELNGKINGEVDVRILLLDPLRSPALFRAFLESSCEEFESIITADRSSVDKPPVDDPYDAHQLFVSIQNAYVSLRRLPNFENRVRFYGQTPICWAAIIDEKAYFQPYTFGDLSDDPKNPFIGHQMPVIVLQGRTRPIRILEDHFDRLWRTSDVDLFHLGGRIIAKEILLWKMFKQRLPWFRQVYGALCNDRPSELQREHVRQPCFWRRLLAVVTWEDGTVTKGKIIDLAGESALLELDLAVDSERFSSLPEHSSISTGVAIVVRLDVHVPDSRQRKRKERPADYLVSHLLEPSKHRFTYILKEVRKIRKKEVACIALRAQKDQPLLRPC